MLDILDNLTEEQRKILHQFRLNLEDLLTLEHTDYVLVKYLRAKSFDLKAAVKVFTENHYNRITFGINTILDTYKKPEVVEKYETTSILGYAKDGTLIRYSPCGRLDFYGLIMSMSCHDLAYYFSYIMESDRKLLKDQSLKTGKNIQEVTYVMDLEGFTIQQILHMNVIEMGQDFVRLLQDIYPEAWSQVLVVNAPKIFDKAYKIFKPFMRVTMLERIHIADKASSNDLLLKYIDENVLPAFLGGKRVDSNGDSECKEFITFGGNVPKTLYGQNTRIPLSPSDPSVKCLNIRLRSMGNVSVAIQEANTKVRLQIKSENGSIYLSVLYREFGPDPDNFELPEAYEYLDETADNFKYKKVSLELRNQAHCTQEDDLLTLKRPGIYVIRFNNSSNWFTSRKLLVKLDICPSS